MHGQFVDYDLIGRGTPACEPARSHQRKHDARVRTREQNLELSGAQFPLQFSATIATNMMGDNVGLTPQRRMLRNRRDEPTSWDESGMNLLHHILILNNVLQDVESS